MQNQPFFEFSVDRKTNTISVKRVFAAKLPMVWKAWTTSEILDQWWVSDGWEAFTKSMSFKEGGHRHYVMKGSGEELWGLTSYLTIQTHTNFAGKECFSDEQANVNEEYPQSDYSVAFHDQGESKLIEHSTMYRTLEELEASLGYGFEAGTVGAYQRLDQLLAKTQ